MIKEYVKVTTNLNQSVARVRGHKKRYIACFETALIVLGLLGNFFLLQHVMWWPDAGLRFNALSELLLQGKMPDTKYSIVGPLFSIPFWYLDNINQTFWWTTRYNVFVFSIGLLATYWLLKDHVDHGLLRKFFLLLIVASMFSHHLLFYYGEVFTAILVAVGCVAIVVGPGIVGWCVIILGVVNTPATLFSLVLLDAKHIFASRRVRYVLAIIVAAVLIMLESWIRRGSPLASGYADDHGAHTVMPYSGRHHLVFCVTQRWEASSAYHLHKIRDGLTLVGRALAILFFLALSHCFFPLGRVSSSLLRAWSFRSARLCERFRKRQRVTSLRSIHYG